MNFSLFHNFLRASNNNSLLVVHRLSFFGSLPRLLFRNPGEEGVPAHGQVNFPLENGPFWVSAPLAPDWLLDWHRTDLWYRTGPLAPDWLLTTHPKTRPSPRGGVDEDLTIFNCIPSELPSPPASFLCRCLSGGKPPCLLKKV